MEPAIENEGTTAHNHTTWALLGCLVTRAKKTQTRLQYVVGSIPIHFIAHHRGELYLTMAKALTDEVRKLRLELVNLAGQGVRTQAEAGHYDAEQVAELTKQLERVAKFLNVKN